MTLLSVNAPAVGFGPARLLMALAARRAARREARRAFYVHRDAVRLERGRRDVENFWRFGP